MCSYIKELLKDIVVFIFVVCNFLTILIGLTFTCLGLWMLLDPVAQAMVTIAQNAAVDTGVWTAAVVLLLLAGILCICLGCLGWYGIHTKNETMLTVYQIAMAICILIEIASGVLAICYNTEFNLNVQANMINEVKQEYSVTGYEYITDAWDTFQVRIQCCGGSAWTDYHQSQFRTNSDNDNPAPWTCCTMKNHHKVNKDEIRNPQGCWNEAKMNYLPSSPPWLNENGCYYPMVNIIYWHTAIIFGCIFGFFIFQIIGFVFVFILKRRLDDEYTKSGM